MKTIILSIAILLSSLTIKAQVKPEQAMSMFGVFMQDTFRSVAMGIHNNRVFFLLDDINIYTNGGLEIVFFLRGAKDNILIEMSDINLRLLEKEGFLEVGTTTVDTNFKKVKDSDSIMIYFYDNEKTHFGFSISGMQYKKCLEIMEKYEVLYIKKY